MTYCEIFTIGDADCLVMKKIAIQQFQKPIPIFSKQLWDFLSYIKKLFEPEKVFINLEKNGEKFSMIVVVCSSNSCKDWCNNSYKTQ